MPTPYDDRDDREPNEDDLQDFIAAVKPDFEARLAARDAREAADANPNAGLVAEIMDVARTMDSLR